MTKNLQKKILYQLELLKSIGYNYTESIDIKNANNEQVDLPDDLNALEEIVKNCYLCQLSKYRENPMFSYGNPKSKVMILKETPTISEDELGEFYVGKSGDLLSSMIEKVLNVKKEELYITNIVKCICSSSDMKIDYVNYCKGYLEKQIDLIKPKLVIALGEGTYQYFTNDATPFNEVRGKVIRKDDLDIITTYEPSFLLRNPSSKKDAYEDLLKIKAIMEKL